MSKKLIERMSESGKCTHNMRKKRYYYDNLMNWKCAQRSSYNYQIICLFNTRSLKQNRVKKKNEMKKI